MRAAADRRTSFAAWLSAGLVAVLLFASGAPCTGIAAPADRPADRVVAPAAAISLPGDPCRPRKGVPAVPVCCAQAACQAMGEPPPRVTTGAAPSLSRADFDLSTASLAGRRDEPPTPPPRTPMS